MKTKKFYWETRELVIIGSFAALIKIISFLVSIAGGGMNPLALIAKNVVATSLLIILISSVRKFGVLTLYVAISGIIIMLTMGRGMMLLPGLLIAGILCELIIKFTGGYKSTRAIIMGVFFFDILFRVISLVLGFLFTRENPQLMIMAVVVVSIGYVGCLIGLGVGSAFAKELKHAGIIKV
ncbi:MAG: MptD family putative ECF transporter S component [Candidatus Sabulitectum sp.]|nr:MptD family putative ECF transporter S component [Candidatus Sabulitectum sp.]